MKAGNSVRFAENKQGKKVARRNHAECNEENTGLMNTTNVVSSGDLCLTSETPHLPIPQALATHRLQPLSNTNRPRPIAHEEEPLKKKQYSFLSSSPPHIEELVDSAENQCEDQSLSMMSGQIASQKTDIISSRNFHTTSMAQLQTEGVPTKTLGVRRSMNGWSARGRQGFSIPKMDGSKR